MNQITPTIKLHTCQQHKGIYLNALILEYRGNNFHIHGSTGDTINVFTEGVGIYVLSINKNAGYLGLSSYMLPEPDAINSLHLRGHREIRESLGPKWEGMSPETIVRRLIHQMY